MATDGLFDLIRHQHGAIAIRQAAELGISERTLRAIAQREGWPDPFPGRGVRLHPAATPSYEQDVVAAILATGGEALASRLTAAYLHGLVDRPPPHVELVVQRHRDPRPPATHVRVWRSRTLLDEDHETVRRVPTTTLVRTVCDLGAVSSVSRMRGYLIDGRQRRLFTIGDVMRRQAEMPGTKGLPMLRMLCYELDASRCDSVLAWRARQLLTAAGMPPDRSEHPVTARNGVTVHLDVPFVAYRVAVEPEGMGAHAERWQLERDIRRRNTLRGTDWLIIWVTWQRLDDDPEGFVAEVRDELRRRGWPGEPAVA